MKKTFKYILITSIMMFVAHSNVLADGTCKYVMDDSLGGHYLDVDVYFGSDGKPSSVVLNAYNDKSNMNKNVSVNNWNNTLTQKRLQSGQCPKYIIVKSGWFGSYDVYLNYKYDTAKEHCSPSKAPSQPVSYSGDSCLLVMSNETNSNNETLKTKCEEDTKNTADVFQTYLNTELSTESCRDTSGDVKYTSFEECTKTAQNNRTLYTSLYSNAESCVSMGYMSGDNSYYKKVVDLYPQVINKVDNWKTQVEKERDYYIDTGEIVNPNQNESLNGCADMPETISLLKKIYNLIRYLIPVLIIILSIVDFIKVVANGDDKEYKNAWNKFIKRIIVGIVILIVPILISTIISLSGIDSAYGINDIVCIFK